MLLNVNIHPPPPAPLTTPLYYSLDTPPPPASTLRTPLPPAVALPHVLRNRIAILLFIRPELTVFTLLFTRWNNEQVQGLKS